MNKLEPTPATLIGKGNHPAVQEIHIFLGPINPDEETVQRYRQATEEYNETFPRTDKMKSCLLALDFRDVGNVFVMQSARYFRTNDISEVIQATKEDVSFFALRGFEIIREKIEACAFGIMEIPRTIDEMTLFPNTYFEFHIKLVRGCKDVVSDQPEDDYSPMTDEELEMLKTVSLQFQEKFGIPVPLSYNNNGRHQRFLNTRFRNIGVIEAYSKTKEIEKAINETGIFRHTKTISEYVWYDTNPDLDKGWIDF